MSLDKTGDNSSLYVRNIPSNVREGDNLRIEKIVKSSNGFRRGENDKWEPVTCITADASLVTDDVPETANVTESPFQSFSDSEIIDELIRREVPMHTVLEKAGYFGYKLWREEDIANALLEDGYSDCQENIAAVKGTGILTALEDCTDHDWEVFRYAFSLCEDDLIPNELFPCIGSEKYEAMELFDRIVLFSETRIDPDTVPDGMYLYSLRHGDDDSEPLTVEKCVVVNHFGDILTDMPFDGLENEEEDYIRIREDDWGYVGESITLNEFMQSHGK